ncbi:MAG: Fe-S cluster assembly protein SufD [Chloroflexi bacterium]|uniref:Fe-S cluster assembly protein SufD n=1 Tax=Candidatus Chlorohelix allophototropha TaxID=3003348 RepID=A0A8T7MA24_9CHLR|nr:Fe-S cluster assembly protein SufD [Chloroflexota bacterium]WJW68855.1 Fe-S cluster assembly protein SufD [Chloroflexota bacterium L227-S17]
MTSPVVESLLTLEAVEKLSALKQEPHWMLEKRREALKLYEALPLPDWTRGIRGWWTSSLKELKLESLQPFTPAGSSLPHLNLDGKVIIEDEEEGETREIVEQTAGTLVQYNSEVVQVELSEEALAQGVIFCSLDEAVQKHPALVHEYFMTSNVKPDDNKFAALHAALWSGGAFLYVPKNVVIEAPFRVVFYADTANSAIFSHVLVVAEPHSQVKIIEEQLSASNLKEQALDANIVETFVATGAKVEFYNPQDWGESFFNYSTKRALLKKDSINRWILAVMGSEETRLDVESVTLGEGAHAEAVGAIFPNHEQHLDLKVVMRHSVPNTTGDALFKAALLDKGQYGFQGKIRVDKLGRNTDSFLADHVLFLSEDSKADALPSLDVDANDVRCAHGQTIGMVDEQAIFYLQSRGLSREEAVGLIVQGFFEQVTNRIPLASVRQRMKEIISRKIY